MSIRWFMSAYTHSFKWRSQAPTLQILSNNGLLFKNVCILNPMKQSFIIYIYIYIYLYFLKICCYVKFQDLTSSGEPTSYVCTATVLILFDTKMEIMNMERNSAAWYSYYFIKTVDWLIIIRKVMRLRMIQGHYFTWQIQFGTSRRLAYAINVPHSTDGPYKRRNSGRKWQTVFFR